MQNREMTYVQISRARGETHLFCDEQTAGRDQGELARMVGRSEESYRHTALPATTSRVKSASVRNKARRLSLACEAASGTAARGVMALSE